MDERRRIVDKGNPGMIYSHHPPMIRAAALSHPLGHASTDCGWGARYGRHSTSHCTHHDGLTLSRSGQREGTGRGGPRAAAVFQHHSGSGVTSSCLASGSPFSPWPREAVRRVTAGGAGRQRCARRQAQWLPGRDRPRRSPGPSPTAPGPGFVCTRRSGLQRGVVTCGKNTSG